MVSLGDKPRNKDCAGVRGTIQLRIPVDAAETTEIKCGDCGKLLGTWGELQDDFANQGGHDGIFRLSKGRIKRLE